MIYEMNVLKHLEVLKTHAGTDLRILTDKDDATFQAYCIRWSETDCQIPAAVILPKTEDQIQIAVKWAVSSSISFVTKSGGHSLWSTTGDDGVVIDLSDYCGIDVDVAGQKATLKGSILTKAASVALADAGFFTALGNGNTIGAIPFILNGGCSTTNPVTGYGSDQIIAARLIDARGELIEVTEEKEPDLLYAIRGAGQFFGLVTQLTVKAHPLRELGNPDGTIWSGKFIFPIARAREVGEAMQQIIDDDEHTTSGLIMVMAAPPERKHMVMVTGTYIGDPSKADIAYSALHNLKPIVGGGASVPIQNLNDPHKHLDMKGCHKRYGNVGLRHFDVEAWLETLEVWKKLITDCPDAISTSFSFKWDSRFARQPSFDSANPLQDLRLWQNNLLWYTDSANREVVDKANDDSIAIMRGPNEAEYADYQNATRSDPIEWRFRPASRLEKLKALKETWDPTGVFTEQLLD